MSRLTLCSLVLGQLVWGGALAAQVGTGRARDLGIPLEGNPGPLNAITGVSGVAVGHTTLSGAPDAFESETARCAPE